MKTPHDVHVHWMTTAFGSVAWIAVCTGCYWMGERVNCEQESFRQGVEHVREMVGDRLAYWEADVHAC